MDNATEHNTSRKIIYDVDFLGIERSPGIVIVQIAISVGRTLEQKRALYRGIAERLDNSAGVRPEDTWVNLVEVSRENWSIGLGVASYAPLAAS